MRKRSPKYCRVNARISENQKRLIQRAADLEGRTLTDFILKSAKAAAERTLQERSVLTLSVKQTDEFVEALLAPAAKPGLTLRRAAKRYGKIAGL